MLSKTDESDTIDIQDKNDNGMNFIDIFKIGSFNCDLSSCKDGFANWRQTEGELSKQNKKE